MRAVLDPNVLVSALLSPDGPPARILRAWLDGAFELVVSPLLLDELARVLAYPKLAVRISPEAAVGVLALLSSAMRAPDGDEPPVVPVADPDDAYLVVLAARTSSLLVTGDGALLELASRIPVVSPAVFATQLALTD